MGRFWSCTILFGVNLVAHSALLAADPTPLVPHPYEGRSVLNQERARAEIDDKPAPRPAHELSELEIAKGIVSLNAADFIVAERRFRAALRHDSRNFVAMEYLGAVAEETKRFEEALAWYAKAKRAAPEARWGSINFQTGRVYLELENYERAEIYLRLAIEQGAHLVAANYTLGFALYRQSRYFEAHACFARAKERAQRAAARLSERAMLQAINYYLGEIHARLGFSSYAVANLRETELGESAEVRGAAWRVHAEINKPVKHARLGAFFQYDSNTVLLPSGLTLPAELNSQSSFSSVTTADAGWQSSPAKRWTGGVDGSLYVNTHFDLTLGGFDVLSLAADGWIAYWNQRDWSIKGWYDLNHAFVDRTAPSSFQTNHGPAFAVNYAPFQRWNYEMGLKYRFNSFAVDPASGPDVRSGTSYVAFLNVALKSPNPRFRPNFGYVFELDDAGGVNFDARFHMLRAGAEWRVFDKTLVDGVASWGKRLYPNHLVGREDTRVEVRVGARHLLNTRWTLLVNVVQLDNSSSLDDFDYSRLTFTTGAAYTF